MFIIGHRGACRFLPENTLESFRLAFESTDMIEFDVHTSKDLVPVVIHDATLERTTDGNGFVNRKSHKELSLLDAGFNFDPDKNRSFPYRGKGMRILSLEEMFTHFPDKKLLIEIKENSPELTHAVMALVKTAEELCAKAV